MENDDDEEEGEEEGENDGREFNLLQHAPPSMMLGKHKNSTYSPLSSAAIEPPKALNRRESILSITRVPPRNFKQKHYNRGVFVCGQ